jgi:serine/threonine-protein kinase RsbW
VIDNLPQLICRVPADLSELDAICQDLKNLLQAEALDSNIFICELLLREAFNNAVLHGSNNDINKKVLVEVSCMANYILLSIEDEGPGFDWQKKRAFDLVDETATSGRGISIYKCNGTNVSFNAKGNRVNLLISAKSISTELT